jgi:hypothetical protein
MKDTQQFRTASDNASDSVRSTARCPPIRRAPHNKGDTVNALPTGSVTKTEITFAYWNTEETQDGRCRGEIWLSQLRSTGYDFRKI